MALPAVDIFDRANQNPLAGNWTSGTTDLSDMRLLSNAVQSADAGDAFGWWSADAFGADQYSECKIISGSDGGPAARCSASKCYYWTLLDGGKVWRYNGGGSWTSIGTVAVAPSSSDVMRIAVTGTGATVTIKVYQNGTLKGTLTDTTAGRLTSGSAGLYSAGATVLDDWAGGNVSAATTYTEAGADVSTHQASGASNLITPRTGAGASARQAGATTALRHADTIAVERSMQVSGAGGQVYRETGSASTPHRASGVDIPWYHASALALTTGAISSGQLEDTYSDNGTELVLTETVGTPGFVYDFTFGEYDPVPASVHTIYFKAWYQGNKPHNVILQQWNYTTSGWTNVTGAAQDFPSVASEQTYAFRINASADYLSNGQIKLRLNHTSPGNINHLMHIDYMYLTPIKIETVSGEAPHEASGADVTIAPKTGQSQAPHVSIGADVIVTSDTGAAVMPGVASGADVTAHIYEDAGAAEQPKESSGIDALVMPDSASVEAPHSAAGDDVISHLYAEAGAAEATLESSGADVTSHLYDEAGAAEQTKDASGLDALVITDSAGAETPHVAAGEDVYIQRGAIVDSGEVQAPLSASGADSVATSDTGASVTPLYASGDDYLINATAGAVETPLSASGEDVYIQPTIQTYTETGVSGITAQAGGADVYARGYIEAGSVESPRDTSGADVLLNVATGAAVAPFGASGVDSVVNVTTGGATSTRAGSVADEFFHALTYIETGAAQMPHTGSGADVYTKPGGGGHGDAFPLNAEYRGVGLEDEWLGRINDDEEVLIAYALL